MDPRTYMAYYIENVKSRIVEHVIMFVRNIVNSHAAQCMAPLYMKVRAGLSK